MITNVAELVCSRGDGAHRPEVMKTARGTGLAIAADKPHISKTAICGAPPALPILEGGRPPGEISGEMTGNVPSVPELS